MTGPEPPAQATEDDGASFREDVARGIASAEAGRLVPYEAVRRWILSWGTDEERAPPSCK